MQAALGGLQWHRGARCAGCRFLERWPRWSDRNGVSRWYCGNAWRYCMERYGYRWRHKAMDLGYLGPDHVFQHKPPPENSGGGYQLIGGVLLKGGEALPIYSTGRFACWLFQPGESLSARAFRDGHWPEYLALKALGGG